MGVFLAFLKAVHDIDLIKDIRKLSVGIGNDIGGKDEVK